MMVWDMDLEEWVQLKYWMRYCPSIWTNGFSEEFWKELFDKEKIPDTSLEKIAKHLANELRTEIDKTILRNIYYG